MTRPYVYNTSAYNNPQNVVDEPVRSTIEDAIVSTPVRTTVQMASST